MWRQFKDQERTLESEAAETVEAFLRTRYGQIVHWSDKSFEMLPTIMLTDCCNGIRVDDLDLH